MTDSATLKILRATEHISALNTLFHNKRPFSYVLETNIKTGQRATYAKRNESVINSAAVICGDAIHNIGSALDHAYWERVSPYLFSEWEKKTAQFPFSETKAKLGESIKKRHADRVSQDFYQALMDLQPHSEPGGNEYLYLIHKFDIIDKHKLLIPTGDYTRISSEMLVKQIPDFPRGLINCGFGQNRRDVAWDIPSMNRAQRRAMRLPKSGILEQELNVPVEIVFTGEASLHSHAVIPTLKKLIDVAKDTIGVIRQA